MMRHKLAAFLPPKDDQAPTKSLMLRWQGWLAFICSHLSCCSFQLLAIFPVRLGFGSGQANQDLSALRWRPAIRLIPNSFNGVVNRGNIISSCPFLEISDTNASLLSNTPCSKYQKSSFLDSQRHQDGLILRTGKAVSFDVWSYLREFHNLFICADFHPASVVPHVIV